MALHDSDGRERPEVRLTTFELYEWVAYAACCEPDAPSMFPHPTDDEGQIRAKDTCAKCPVAHECLSQALASNEAHGVWGGLNEDERRQLKKRQSRERSSRRQAGSVETTVTVVGDVL